MDRKIAFTAVTEGKVQVEIMGFDYQGIAVNNLRK